MDKKFKETLLESILERQESHWSKRKTKKGQSQVSSEYEQHKKTRNATGAARDQDRRKRNTEKGHKQAAARDAVRRAKEQGKLKEPSTCSVCGKATSDKIFDHDGSYEKSDQLKGRFMCRECHNRKDNNKPGDASAKGKRRQGIIGRSAGSQNIKKSHSESFKRVIADLNDPGPSINDPNVNLIAGGMFDPLECED